MARIEGQKAKLLLLLRILARYTDEDHWITVPRILELLGAEGAGTGWPGAPFSCPSSSCWWTRCRPPSSSPKKRASS